MAEAPEFDLEKEIAVREGLKQLADIMGGKLTLQEVSGLSDKEVHSILQLGAMLYQQGRRAEAEDIFRGAVLLNKNNALAQSALGTVLTAGFKYDEALGALNEALRLDDKDIASYVNRAEVFMQKGDFQSASEDLKRAVELDPEGDDPAANRARAIIIGMGEVIKELQKRIDEGQL